MDIKARESLSTFLRICSDEINAGNCNLTEAEAAAIIDTMIQARRRELDPQSQASMMRRIAESYLDMAQKVDHLQDDVNEIKKGGRVVNMTPRR